MPPEAPIKALVAALVEWGWLLLIPAGFVWLYWTVTNEAVETKPKTRKQVPAKKRELLPRKVAHRPEFTAEQRTYAALIPALTREQRETLYKLYQGPQELYITNYIIKPLIHGDFIVVLYPTVGLRGMCALRPEIRPVVKAHYDDLVF